jgi:voltage-gated potassium channel
MAEHSDPLAARLVNRRFEAKGLRPRVAASIIAVLWLIAIVVFGIVQHWVDPDTFETVWDGMWWATQTVTTVGYGDIVPADTAGQVIAAVMMVGGLSLFAVVTGAITSEFVARAEAERRGADREATSAQLETISAQLLALREQLEALETRLPPGPPGPAAR